MRGDGYKEKVTDEELINLIESGVFNSVGNFLNSSELTRERLKGTYEYALMAKNHLAPQGVSEIVDSSTTEVIEAYTAILSDLLIGNGKLARFIPYDGSPGAFKSATVASDITNHCIFKTNNGWEIIEKWMKSALLWKNAIIRWDFEEDYDYDFEEFEFITEEELDATLNDDKLQVVGNIVAKQDEHGEVYYNDVRIRRTIDKSGVKISLVPPENFRITREATTFDDASFISVQVEMTRSEIRKQWPEIAGKIKDWDELSVGLVNTEYTEEVAARKDITGQEYQEGIRNEGATPLEANRTITVTEAWIRADRDGDGIAELKKVFIAGTHILFEEDVESVSLAMICPFDIPHEFYGLSMADMVRPTTLASTAILRGFVENTYLTNYSPKLADPNVVDFSALQNMKPKQIIPVRGNPAAAVHQMPPETISTGTVPLLEHLQAHKEQGTGMSKAAQGLQDELFVSGNSEIKLQAVMSASQKRIQHIARRFSETGVKRLISGVYYTIRKNLDKVSYSTPAGLFKEYDMSLLPTKMELEVDVDIGENSKSSVAQKLQIVGNQILPALTNAGGGMAVKPEAAAILATMGIDAMGFDPSDFLEDYTTDEFKQKAQKAQEAQNAAQQEAKAEETRLNKTKSDKAEADARLVKVQADNALQDNVRQTAIAMDKSMQEWEKLIQSGQKDSGSSPTPPDMQKVIQTALVAVLGMSKAIRAMDEPDGQQQSPEGALGPPGADPGEIEVGVPNEGGL